MAEDDDNPIRCPKCRASMRHMKLESVAVDRCETCSGVWLDALEKDKLLDHKCDVKKLDAPAARPHECAPPDDALNCPRDRSQLIHMVDHNQPHIHYESCTICGGTFFDAGELHDLNRRSLLERVQKLFGIRKK